ncbi:hypothetical protein F5Y03DRAFT_405585 [Xylaria venustula]|nr:hypothetical protein F5Y03DRAFT_405585 [Xylaria venustula]
MTASLEGLPVELIEKIVEYLIDDPVHDVGSLRLTSRNIESKASYGCFTEHFDEKGLNLNIKDLEDLVYLTRRSSLVCRLQHCYFKGEYNGLDEYIPVGTLTHLLAMGFRNLKNNSRTGSLASLHLEGHAVLDFSIDHVNKDNWFTRCWATFRRMFTICMTALGEANLPVTDHLMIFGHTDAKPNCLGIHCSLEYDVFLAFAQSPALTGVFKRVKRLTLSLSSPMCDNVAQGIRWDNAPCDASKIRQSLHAAASLTAILQMSQLESLDLEWDDLGLAALSLHGRDVTRPTTISPPAPMRLKKCDLISLWLSEEDLLRFLKASRPTNLNIQLVRLIGGTYASLFKLLTDPGTPTEYYKMHEIAECHQLVDFRKRGGWGFTITSKEVKDTGRKDIEYSVTPMIPNTDGVVVLVPLPQPSSDILVLTPLFQLPVPPNGMVFSPVFQPPQSNRLSEDTMESLSLARPDYIRCKPYRPSTQPLCILLNPQIENRGTGNAGTLIRITYIHYILESYFQFHHLDSLLT